MPPVGSGDATAPPWALCDPAIRQEGARSRWLTCSPSAPFNRLARVAPLRARGLRLPQRRLQDRPGRAVFLAHRPFAIGKVGALRARIVEIVGELASDRGPIAAGRECRDVLEIELLGIVGRRSTISTTSGAIPSSG